MGLKMKITRAIMRRMILKEIKDAIKQGTSVNDVISQLSSSADSEDMSREEKVDLIVSKVENLPDLDTYISIIASFNERKDTSLRYGGFNLLFIT